MVDILESCELLDFCKLLVFGEVVETGAGSTRAREVGVTGAGLAETGEFGANARVARFATQGGAVSALGGGEVAGPAGGIAQDEVRPDVVGLVADGLRSGIDGVGPTAGCTEHLGEGDAATPVGGRGADSLPSGGDGLLVTAEAAQGLAGETVCPRPVPTERHRPTHGDQGSGRVATIQQRGGQPAPDL
nr:hypothetical protein [Kutzneria chonburiensis]